MRPIAISPETMQAELDEPFASALEVFASADPAAALQMKEIWVRARAQDTRASESRARSDRGAARVARAEANAADKAARSAAYAPVQAANDAVQRAKWGLDAGYAAMRQAQAERGHVVLPGEFRIGELQHELKAAKKAASLALSVYRGRSAT